MSETIHQRRGLLDAIVDLLIAFKWPLTIAAIVTIVGTVGGLWVGLIPSIPTPPPWFWGYLTYLLIAAILAALPAYLVVTRWYDPPGVRIVESDPQDGDYRLLKVGPRLWEDMIVEAPSDRVGGIDDLNRVQINGRPGVEVLSVDVPDEDDPRDVPIATPNWLAGATAAEVRAYRSTLEYVQDSLAERADRGTQLRANYPNLIREGVERVLADIIRTTESHGVPHGETIQDVLDDVVGRYDQDDPGPEQDVRRDLDDDRDELLDRGESWEDRLSIDIDVGQDGTGGESHED